MSNWWSGKRKTWCSDSGSISTLPLVSTTPGDDERLTEIVSLILSKFFFLIQRRVYPDVLNLRLKKSTFLVSHLPWTFTYTITLYIRSTITNACVYKARSTSNKFCEKNRHFRLKISGNFIILIIYIWASILVQFVRLLVIHQIQICKVFVVNEFVTI